MDRIDKGDLGQALPRTHRSHSMNLSSGRAYLPTRRVRWMIILLVTAAGILWLNQRGPVPVMRGTMPLAGTVPYWYMLAAFPFLGMLVADWVSLLIQGRPLLVLELGFQIGLLITLSSLRLATAIPLSGHILLFAYFIVRRVLVPFPQRDLRKVECGLAILVFGVASYVKLFWWSDPETLAAGSLLGTILACASYGIWVYSRGSLIRGDIRKSG